jgi:competence transcription factor ComK
MGWAKCFASDYDYTEVEFFNRRAPGLRLVWTSSVKQVLNSSFLLFNLYSKK